VRGKASGPPVHPPLTPPIEGGEKGETPSEGGGNRRGRPCFGAALAAVLLLFSLGALGEVRIGALEEDVSHWQEVAARAQAAGLSDPESALYQQVYILSLFGRTSVDLVEIPEGWLPQVLGRLLDLSPYAEELERAGVKPFSYWGRVIGVKLPWREEGGRVLCHPRPGPRRR